MTVEPGAPLALVTVCTWGIVLRGGLTGVFGWYLLQFAVPAIPMDGGVERTTHTSGHDLVLVTCGRFAYQAQYDKDPATWPLTEADPAFENDGHRHTLVDKIGGGANDEGAMNNVTGVLVHRDGRELARLPCTEGEAQLERLVGFGLTELDSTERSIRLRRLTRRLCAAPVPVPRPVRPPR